MIFPGIRGHIKKYSAFIKFATNEDLVRQLAKMLQRRIVIRPDPSVITDIDTAEKKIRNIPKQATLFNES